MDYDFIGLYLIKSSSWHLLIVITVLGALMLKIFETHFDYTND